MVKRYRMALDYDGNGESFPGVEEAADGEWVEAKDHDALAARLADAEAKAAKYRAALESLIEPDGEFYYSSTGTDWVLSVIGTPDSASADQWSPEFMAKRAGAAPMELPKILPADQQSIASACLCLPFKVYPDCPIHGAADQPTERAE